MHSTVTARHLLGILEHNLEDDQIQWINGKLDAIVSSQSARDLYLTYTLLANKVPSGQLAQIPPEGPDWQSYLDTHKASLLELSRIYLLSAVLEANPDFFVPKVAQLIQLADTSELETFLRYLVLLPQAVSFRQAAVEALRTNIATVFDAIALDNPYPSQYFNDQQWNQMYLKAAFMQRDLGKIRDVDERANKDLARIISDYAHERWAASRTVDPLFWRPVGKYLEGSLLEDIKRLLQSEEPAENRAGALCCYQSGTPTSAGLLRNHQELQDKIIKGTLTWNNLKE